MSYDLSIRASSAPRVNRRAIIAGALSLGTFALVAPTWAQTPAATSQAQGDADALEVLRAAGQHVLELETFTYSLETIAGSSTIFPGIEVESIVGAVRRPMDVSATLNVRALMQTMSVSAVVVDGSVYVQNPLSGGAWENMGSAPEIANMINPDWLLLAAINLIQDARITGERDDSTLIEGYVNLSETFNGLDAQELESLEQFLATGPVDVAFWINSDNYLTRAEIYGPIFASESPDVEKRIELENFDEPVDIFVPDI